MLPPVEELADHRVGPVLRALGRWQAAEVVNDQRCWEAAQNTLQVSDLVACHIDLHVPAEGMHFLGHRFAAARRS